MLKYTSNYSGSVVEAETDDGLIFTVWDDNWPCVIEYDHRIFHRDYTLLEDSK